MSDKPRFRYEQGSKAEQVALYESQAKIFPGMIEKQLEILDLRPGMKVLDAGCGSGAVSRRLALKVNPGEVLGIDIDPFYIDEATRLASVEGQKNVRFELGDLNKSLRFEDGAFDLCYSRLVLMFARDPVKTVGELKRITRKGGVLAVADNDDGAWLVYPEMPKLWDLWTKYGDFAKAYGEDGRIGRKLFSIFSAAGLKPINVYTSQVCSTQQTPQSLKLFPMIASRLLELNKTAMIGEGLITAVEYDEAMKEIPLFLNHPGAFSMASFIFAVGRVQKFFV